MDTPRLDHLAKALARATTRRATIGALLSAFAVGSVPQMTMRGSASTSGCYGTTCGCGFGYTCCQNDCSAGLAKGVFTPRSRASWGCFDLAYDPDHCGRCDVQCAADEFCISGTCQRIERAAPGSQATAPGGVPLYRAFDLGTGSGNSGRASLISADGAVAGYYAQSTNDAVDPSTIRLVLWRADGTAVDLTALGITDLLWFDATGNLVAWRGNQPVRYIPATNSVEPAPNAMPSFHRPAAFVRAIAAGRNQHGSVVGTLFPHANDNDGARGFVLTDQGVTVLDPVSGGDTSAAYDINDAGIVVGGPAPDPSGPIPLPGLGFRYDTASGNMVPLTVEAYDGAAGYAINARGDIVGLAHHVSADLAWALPSTDAVLWPAGATGTVDLDETLLPRDANWHFFAPYDINDAGEIVGAGWVSTESYIHPFVLWPIP